MDDTQVKQIPRELDGLEGDISELKGALNVLEESLSSALREPGPGPGPPCNTVCEDTSANCDLANRIAAYRQRVGELVLFVRDLASRVEV